MVIAIIAILASLLLPAVQKAKDLANHVVCMSNLKGIYLGHMLYVQDYFFVPAKLMGVKSS